jgi:hypothetical protein
MATGRRVWATGRTWAIKGVSDRTRAAVLEAAHGAGLTVGEWVEQVLARATEEARHPKPSPAGAGRSGPAPSDMAGVLEACRPPQTACSPLVRRSRHQYRSSFVDTA